MEGDKESIRGLQWLEQFGLLSASDRNMLDNYKRVYPQYFLDEKKLDRAISADAFPNK